jgi:putative transposase
MHNKRTRHAAYQINYHFVWCPKFRRPVLEGAVGMRLAELIPQIVERNGGEVLDLVVQSDHVHVLVSFPPTLAANPIMQRVKGYTAHELREEFPELSSRWPSLWTRRYYVGTAGNVSAATIARYIEEQQGR